MLGSGVHTKWQVRNMAVQLEKRLFTVEEYERMIEAGVFDEDEHLELIRGEIIAKHPIERRLFTLEEYERMIEAGGFGEGGGVGVNPGGVVGVGANGFDYGSRGSRPGM